MWSSDKGLADFIELSRKPNNVVILVGMTKAQVAEYSSDKYDDCNLIPVQRTQNQYELAMLYSLTDVYISLSYSETFGLTIVEANACGTPVVAYDNTAQPELVQSDNGVIVKSGDVAAVAEAIRKIKEHPLSPADCRKRAEQKFDKNTCFEKYISLYERLLQK